jgi:glycosyltransferase involved in cell wall biosynthesis
METAAHVSAGPRVVLGMPAYNRPDVLAKTLESLLSQTVQDFALVICDDAPSDAVAAIVEAYRADFRWLVYEANPSRLGMVENWRLTFERARALWPGSEYFAWVSDHDLWHPRWLAEMIATLDASPDVVLAYPRCVHAFRNNIRMRSEGFDTTGLPSRGARLRLAARYMLAGDMIYGVMRAEALQAAGVFRRVVTPDRQVLLALSLFGRITQVPAVLWYREISRGFDLQRQRDVFFPNGVPWYMYLPSHLQHCAVLLWDYGVRGKGRPAFGCLAGVGYAVTQLWASTARQIFRRKAWT